MIPVSGLRDFSGPLADLYDEARRDHHPAQLLGACVGCHHVASAVFAASMRQWEAYLQDALVDEMCGMGRGTLNCPAPRPTPLQPNSVTATRELLRTRYTAYSGNVSLKGSPGDFILLHNPRMIAGVASHWVRHSRVADTAIRRATDIERLITLRHGISHGTRHAQMQARATMLALEPTHAFASLGAFLTFSPVGSSENWLELLLGDLCDLAMDIRA